MPKVGDVVKPRVSSTKQEHQYSVIKSNLKSIHLERIGDPSFKLNVKIDNQAVQNVFDITESKSEGYEGWKKREAERLDEVLKSKWTLETFCEKASISFRAEGWNEWNISFPGGFSATFRQKDYETKELALEAAFKRFDFIKQHNGKISINGGFRNEEKIPFDNLKKTGIVVRIAYSHIAKRWFYTCDYFYKTGSGSGCVSIFARSVENREQAIFFAMLQGRNGLIRNVDNVKKLDKAIREQFQIIQGMDIPEDHFGIQVPNEIYI